MDTMKVTYELDEGNERNGALELGKAQRRGKTLRKVTKLMQINKYTVS